MHGQQLFSNFFEEFSCNPKQWWIASKGAPLIGVAARLRGLVYLGLITISIKLMPAVS
jgi:hypothetical protein